MSIGFRRGAVWECRGGVGLRGAIWGCTSIDGLIQGLYGSIEGLYGWCVEA